MDIIHIYIYDIPVINRSIDNYDNDWISGSRFKRYLYYIILLDNIKSYPMC